MGSNPTPVASDPVGWNNDGSGLQWHAANYDLGGMGYNVRATKYGAVGTGAVSDSNAFSLAANDAHFAPAGGMVIVPPGTYLIDIALPAYSNVVYYVIGATFTGAQAATVAPAINFDKAGNLVAKSVTTVANGPYLSDFPAGSTNVLTSGASISIYDKGGAYINVAGPKYRAIGTWDPVAGSGDCTTAVHQARDDAGIGGTIVFPPGTYQSPALTANKANQTWLVQSGAKIVHAAAAAASSALITVTANGMTFDGAGIIDGNQVNQTQASIDGIRFSQLGTNDPASGAISGGTVKGSLTFQNIVSAGISMFIASNMMVIGARFQDALLYAVRIRRSCSDVWVRGCRAYKTVQGTASTAFQVDGLSDKTGVTSCFRIHIVDCIANTWASGGIYMNGTLDGEIAVCHAENCGDIGIDFEWCSFCVAIGCTSRGNVNRNYACFQQDDHCGFVGCSSRGATSTSNGEGFFLGNSSDRCYVLGGSSFHDAGRAVYIAGTGVDNCSVGGGFIATGNGASGNAVSGIEVLGAKGTKIGPVHVQNYYSRGVLFNLATYFTLIGSVLKNNNQGAGTVGGIGVVSTSAHYEIVGNISTDDLGAGGTQSFGIEFGGSDDWGRIINNEFGGNKTGATNGVLPGANSRMAGNAGFNPQGMQAIAVTASPFTYTNSDAVVEAIYIVGGAVTTITKNGLGCYSFGGAAANGTVLLEPNEALVVTYTTAPTMNKDRK